MVDIAKIKVKAGSGGDGKVSFYTARGITKGGPDGGDGGNGGSVYFVADNNLNTLMDFRSKELYEAQSGEGGGKKNMTGASGEDLYIKIPVGTLVYEIEENGRESLVGDMIEPGQKLMIAQGGIGGKGNYKFRGSTNQTPMQYVPGTLGEEKEIRLEIKLIADVGFVGAPNAGKSTLLNRLTNANAKVANYPFTTLTPNLGICKLKNGQSVVLADIPGLIEGASQGKGLGDDFLRHIERTRLLVHIIDPLDGSADNYVENAVTGYEMIRKELKEYGHGLEDKDGVIVINKMDVTEVKESFQEISNKIKELGVEVLGISAASGEGMEGFLQKISEKLNRIPKTVSFEVHKVVKKYTIDNLPNKRVVFNKDKVKTLEKRL
ncbi:GTPase ObgE [Patescibacteria group bacterium]|nr:GTPase ObgE [Patescibacteria group bacterium]MBU1952741.1 GTPase ObgE [Patescibacteria group bacterium]